MLPCSMRVAGVMMGNEAVLSPWQQAFAADRLSVARCEGSALPSRPAAYGFYFKTPPHKFPPLLCDVSANVQGDWQWDQG